MSVLAKMVPVGISILVESAVFELGVTIVLPSWLIQCAWGCAEFSPGCCVRIRRSMPVAPGTEFHRQSSSPLRLTCTWSVSTRVITWAGDWPTYDVLQHDTGQCARKAVSLLSNHWVW